MPGITELIKRYMQAGYIFVVVSNQGGIQQGYHTAEEIELKLEAVLNALGREIGLIPPHGRYAWFYCASFDPHPDRKPNPGMLNQACQKLDIDPTRSVMVGDMDSDRAASAAASIREYYHVTFFLDRKPFPRYD